MRAGIFTSAAGQALLLLPLAGMPSAQEVAAEQALAPRLAGPLKPVAGLGGIKTVSQVRFAAAPDDLHELEVVLMFPDRARWKLSRKNTEDRRIEYRHGEHVYVLEVAERESIAPSPVERQAILRQMILRRAAFLWPDGTSWEGDGASRTAALHGLSGSADSAPIGTLVADLDEHNRPARIVVKDAEGAVQEALEILEWQESSGRSWPARMRVLHGGQPIWEETVDHVVPRVQYLESFFLPADRRELLRGLARPEKRSLPAATVRIEPLAQGTGWEKARQLSSELMLAEAPQLRAAGFKLEPLARLELTTSGEPAAIVLRLAEAVAAPPPGWRTEQECKALVLSLEGTTAPSAQDLALLRNALGSGHREAGLRAEIGPSQITLLLLLADAD